LRRAGYLTGDSAYAGSAERSFRCLRRQAAAQREETAALPGSRHRKTIMLVGMKQRLLFVPFLVLSLLFGVRAGAEEHSVMSGGAGDTRQPLPLPAMMAEHQKQNMRGHLAAIEAIVAAIGHDDMDAVAQAAGRIGYSQAMGQMCEHMGAAAPGFTAMALNFHHTADTIGDAARRGDRAGVLSALDRTLQTCVSCHATYRQEVVDEKTWERLTAATTSH
jgi:cytochrome c556